MIRTAVNITGDSVVTCIVAKSEGEMDIARFNDPLAATEDEAVRFHPNPQPQAQKS
jgi:Na+/H+-dicarboxylate symporter